MPPTPCLQGIDVGSHNMMFCWMFSFPSPNQQFSMRINYVLAEHETEAGRGPEFWPLIANRIAMTCKIRSLIACILLSKTWEIAHVKHQLQLLAQRSTLKVLKNIFHSVDA